MASKPRNGIAVGGPEMTGRTELDLFVGAAKAVRNMPSGVARWLLGGGVTILFVAGNMTGPNAFLGILQSGFCPPAAMDRAPHTHVTFNIHPVEGPRHAGSAVLIEGPRWSSQLGREMAALLGNWSARPLALAEYVPTPEERQHGVCLAAL